MKRQQEKEQECHEEKGTHERIEDAVASSHEGKETRTKEYPNPKKEDDVLPSKRTKTQFMFSTNK